MMAQQLQWTQEMKEPALNPCSTNSVAFVFKCREQLYFKSAAKMFSWHIDSKSKVKAGDSDNLMSSLVYPWAEKRPGARKGTGCPPFSTQELGLLQVSYLPQAVEDKCLYHHWLCSAVFKY